MDALLKKKLKSLVPFIEKKGVKEIIINKPGEVGLEMQGGKWEWVSLPTLTKTELNDISSALATASGQKYSSSNALLSCKLPDHGHRVQVIGHPYSLSGFSMAIRVNSQARYPLEQFGFDDIVPDHTNEDYGALDIPGHIAHVVEAVRQKKTILVSGGTSSGKTTFLNELLPHIPEDERIITLEGVNELKVPHKNWCGLVYSENKTDVGGQGVSDLLNATLRMRPDRIIMGEIRKENAMTFLRAVNTGHEGSLATIHANTPAKAIAALITNIIMNGDAPDSAIPALQRQIAEDIYGIVQLNRVHGKMQAYFQRITPGMFA